MKYLAAVLLLLPLPALADTDFELSWNISGLFVGGEFDQLIELDLEFGSRYFPVNGSVVDGGGSSSPATGTCFATGLGGIFCNLQVDQLSYTMVLDENLNGEVRVKDANGFQLDSGTAIISHLLDVQQ